MCQKSGLSPRLQAVTFSACRTRTWLCYATHGKPHTLAIFSKSCTVQLLYLALHNTWKRSQQVPFLSKKSLYLLSLLNCTNYKRSPTPEVPTTSPPTIPTWNKSPQSQCLFLYNCLYKFNKGKTASGRSTKTTPYNNGTYECRILQSGNNHVINLKWELNSHFKERETTFDHLFYCWTHCIN